ncbi:ankyrin repeat-containing domain protein [Entophlyctis helioformis]|nr:ankyrin repeat-containing domain protein [Entophlyctis helioformis]
MMEQIDDAPQSQWDDNPSPLHAAVAAGNTAAVQSILADASLSAQAAASLVSQRNKHGATVLARACRLGHTDIVRMLLECLDRAGPAAGTVNQANAFGSTPLMLACGEGHGGVVGLLLAVAGIDANARNGHGFTALMRAVGKGHVGIAEQLVAAFPATLDLDAVNEFGSSALSIAVERGDGLSVSLLLVVPQPHAGGDRGGPSDRAAADAWQTVKGGHNALTLAASRSFVHVAQIVLSTLGSCTDTNVLNHCTPGHGWTALHYAVDRGCTEMVQMLLGAATGAHRLDVNVQDTVGTTPLMMACKGRHAAIADLLLARHDVDINIQSKAGLSALMIAVSAGNTASCAALAHDARIDMHLAENSGKNAVYLACTKSDSTLLAAILEPLAPESLVALLDKRRADGSAAIHAACACPSAAPLAMLLARMSLLPPPTYRRLINTPDAFARTPLHLALESPPHLQSLLQAAGSQLDTALPSSAWHDTPLMTAVRQGNLESVTLLLRHAAIDPHQVNADGKTALDIAVHAAADTSDAAAQDILRLLARSQQDSQ